MNCPAPITPLNSLVHQVWLGLNPLFDLPMPCLSGVNRSFFTSPRESHTTSGTYREQTETNRSWGGTSLGKILGVTHLLIEVIAAWALRYNN